MNASCVEIYTFKVLPNREMFQVFMHLNVPIFLVPCVREGGEEVFKSSSSSGFEYRLGRNAGDTTVHK